MKTTSIVRTTAVFAVVLGAAASASGQTNYPVLVQGVQAGMVKVGVNMVPGWTGVGMGPLSANWAAQGGGVANAGQNLLRATLNGSAWGTWNMGTGMLDPIPWRSNSQVPAAMDQPGSLILNKTGNPITDFEITATNKMDTYNGSMGSMENGKPAWTVTAGKNAGGFATMTIQAMNGVSLADGQRLWLSLPPSPAGAFTGMATPAPAAAKMCVAPKAKAMITPSIGNTTGTATVSYTQATGGLTFNTGTVNIANYVDGSSATSGDPIIGSTISISPTTILGPDSMDPTSYDIANAFITVTNGGQLYESATLTNLTLYSNGLIEGDLNLEENPSGSSSRYVNEQQAFSGDDNFFMQTNLLSATSGLTTDGTGSGTAMIASVSTIPEASTSWLIGVGAATVIGRLRGCGILKRRSNRARNKQNVND